MLRILIGLAAVWIFAGGFDPFSPDPVCGRELSPSLQRDCKPCKRPDGTINHAPNVTDLVLDKIQLKLKPLPDGPPPEDAGRSADMIIKVATNAEDAENDVLDYHYTISGGRIVGSGSSVQWDLNGVMPGTYTITAGVDDSCGICGKTITKAVMIIGKIPVATVPTASSAASAASTPASPSTSGSVSAPAKNSAPAKASAAPSTPVPVRTRTSAPTAAVAISGTGKVCVCPKISIADPERSGTDLIFTTKIDGLFSNQLSFLWTVIGGKVVSQDKNSIRINTGSLALGGSVSVVVNGLEPRCNCPNQARKTF